MSASDAELIRQAVRGDRESLEKLLARHGPTVRERFRHEIPRRWQVVLSEDDVMQEAYTDAFLDIADFVPQGDGSFERWLATIARHNLLNAVEMLEAEKRGGNRRPIDLPTPDESFFNLYEVLAGTTTTPSRHAARTETRVALQRALERLPEDYRCVVQMYDLEGRAIEEVSAALKRRPGAVYMLRGRAHRALRRLLGTPSRTLSDFT